MAQPLSADSEWHLNALQGFTGAAGDNALSFEAAHDVQATLVMETEETAAFCSITVMAGDQPYKQTPTYAQKQAVLSVPLTAGTRCSMVTRCSTQRQDPVKNGALRMLLNIDAAQADASSPPPRSGRRGSTSTASRGASASSPGTCRTRQ